MIDGLVALTVTPGSTPPLLSATLPLIEPVVLAPPPCANACVAASRHAASATTRWNPRTFMNAPPPSVEATLPDANPLLDVRVLELSIEDTHLQFVNG